MYTALFSVTLRIIEVVLEQPGETVGSDSIQAMIIRLACDWKGVVSATSIQCAN